MTGRRLILMTRPAGTADPLVALLRARGHRVAAVPTVTTRPVAPGGPLDAAMAEGGWDWIVVTSAAGARAAAGALPRAEGPTTDGMPKRTSRWAAVGPATAAALKAVGIRAEVVPDDASGLGIAHVLSAAGLHGSRVLLPRADAASPDLPAALRDAGATVREVIAYHTVEAPPESAAAVADALSDAGLAAIVVASGSAVRGLLRLAEDAGLANRVMATPLISIGPSTTAVAHEHGLTTVIQANRPTAESLADAVDAALLTRQPSPTFARRS